MKHLYCLLLLCLPLLAFAQSEPPRDEHGKIVYTEVVSMAETPQAELYARALVAIPQSAKEVVKQSPEAVAWQDEADLLIKGETVRVPVKLRYAVVLQQKDGRYKYAITDFLIEDTQHKGLSPLEETAVYKPVPEKHYFKNGNLKPLGLAIQRINQAHQEEIDKAIAAVVENIKRTMASPTGDNW